MRADLCPCLRDRRRQANLATRTGEREQGPHATVRGVQLGAADEESMGVEEAKKREKWGGSPFFRTFSPVRHGVHPGCCWNRWSRYRPVGYSCLASVMQPGAHDNLPPAWIFGKRAFLNGLLGRVCCERYEWSTRAQGREVPLRRHQRMLGVPMSSPASMLQRRSVKTTLLPTSST